MRKPPKVSRGYGGVARLPVQPGSPDFRGALSYNDHFWVCFTSPDRAWSGIEHLLEFWPWRPWRGSFRCDIYSAWSGIGHLWEFQKTFLSCDFDGGVADILWSHSVQETSARVESGTRTRTPFSTRPRLRHDLDREL